MKDSFAAPNLTLGFKRLDWDRISWRKKSSVGLIRGPFRKTDFVYPIPSVDESPRATAAWEVFTPPAKLLTLVRREPFAEAKKLRVFVGEYFVQASRATLARPSSAKAVALNVRRAKYRPIPRPDDQEPLIREYHRLVEQDSREGLNEADALRLREVERRLDDLESRDASASRALNRYGEDISRLRKLNAIAAELKALL